MLTGLIIGLVLPEGVMGVYCVLSAEHAEEAHETRVLIPPQYIFFPLMILSSV